MLNKDNQRELAYLVKIDSIAPIEGRDRVECAVVGGWTVMVQKGLYLPGDVAVYFEIDSKVPDNMECFAFLEKYHYKVKTQKFKKFYSQGLLMSAKELGWTMEYEDFIDTKGVRHKVGDESRFVTKELGVVYAVEEDNKRKSNGDPNAKYKAMAGRYPKLFQFAPVKWLYKRTWGKKLLFVFFGKKKDKTDTKFPTKFQYVKKTDQERAENMSWVLNDKTPFIKTQKCDGSSGTFILERKSFGRYEFYVCSRNVRQKTPDQKCFYDENYYWDVAIKYDIEKKMKDYMDQHKELGYLCWQGEVCGPGIQKNPHALTENHLFLFHCIDNLKGKWNIIEAEKMWKSYGLEVVPIVDTEFVLPDDFEEFKQQAEGFYDASVCEGHKNQPQEGFVYYKTNDPNFSFKNVSRAYLMKHQG